MGQASGVYKVVSYKSANGTAGIAAAGSGAKQLRRVTAMVDLNKDTYGSNEVRSDLQRSDFRHGVRRAVAKISGELSPGTYADFMAGSCKRDFAAVAAITGLTITITGTGPIYTVARSAGSWLTSGLKIGMVFRFTAGSFTAGNSNKNLVVAAMTALNLSVYVLNNSGLANDTSIATATVTPTGKSTYIPLSGHIEKFFSIEEWYPEVPFSGTGYDLRVSNMQLDLPPSGLATVGFDLMGVDVVENTTQRFTTPTALGTAGITAAVNGVLLYQGAAVAVITAMSMQAASTYTGDPVVGSNIIPSLTPGKVLVNGSISVKFTDTAFRSAFTNETEVALAVALSSDNAAGSEFISFVLSRVKLGGNTRDDGEKEIIQTVPFEALLNSAGGASAATEATTLLIQDSLA
jgi:hypothetical protein